MAFTVQQRLGPSHFTSFSPAAAGDRCKKVCFHWQAGRCYRRPCPFLHAEPPNSHAVFTSPTSKRSLTWRNPNTAGGKGQGEPAAAEGPDRPQADKICRNFVAGSCSFGDKCKFLHSWSVGDGSFSLLTALEGHQKVRLAQSFFLFFLFAFCASNPFCVLRCKVSNFFSPCFQAFLEFTELI